MKGPATFLVIVIGLILLWLVISGRSGNIGAAINALLAGTGSTPTPTGGKGAAVASNTGIKTPVTPHVGGALYPTSDYAGWPSGPSVFNSSNSNSAVDGYGVVPISAASYVSPAGFTYA